MPSSTVTFAGDKTYTSEMHTVQRVRYFNGRKYTVITTHSFMSRPANSRENVFDGNRHWLWLTIYTGLTPDVWTFPTRNQKSFRSTHVHNLSPTALQRALAVMVPDDIQAVPF